MCYKLPLFASICEQIIKLVRASLGPIPDSKGKHLSLKGELIKAHIPSRIGCCPPFSLSDPMRGWLRLVAIHNILPSWDHQEKKEDSILFLKCITFL